MNDSEARHLSQEQLIRAVVDAIDLSPEINAHLSACAACKHSKRQLEKNLEMAGRMARQFSPSPNQKVCLPVKKPMSARLYRWEPALSLVLTTAVFIFIVWWLPLNKATHEQRVEVTPMTIWETEPLMTDIGDLSENALPEVYLDIAGESYSDFDEDFFEFVVPSITNDPLTFNPRGGGDGLC